MQTKTRIILIYAAALGVVAAFFAIVPGLVNVPEPVVTKAPEPRAVPDFTLTDQRGQPVSRADLAGKIWIANFIFSSCPGPCLDLTKRMRALDEALADVETVRLVSFSIDPTNDTPAALANYASRVEAGPRWSFLTGERAITARVAEVGFNFPLSTDPSNFEHSDSIVVVDKTGTVRGWFDAYAASFTEDVRRLVKSL